MSLLGIFVALCLATSVTCNSQFFPRATAGFRNATSTKSDSAPTPLCCYLESDGVGLILWWTSSVEVTVATVSTIVYQYDNTAITSYKTIKANNTQILPTTYFENNEDITISGVPTDIIGPDIGGYDALTTLITGTEFTDPYGTVYTSPTPVWMFNEVTYYTESPIPTAFGYACPPSYFSLDGHDLDVFPSGFYIADANISYGQDNTGEIFRGPLPVELKYWVQSHIPPNNTDPVYSNLGGCTMGLGDGIPIAHVPVTELTASFSTTKTITGNLDGYTTTASVPPSPTYQSQTQPMSKPTHTESSTSKTPTSGAGTPTVAKSTNHGAAGTGPTSIYIDISAGKSAIQITATGASVEAETKADYTSTTAQPASTAFPIFTLDGTTYTINPSSGIKIGTSTLTPGGTLILSGFGTNPPTTYILPTSATALIINGVTEAFSLTTAEATTTIPFLTIGSETYTANSVSEYVIGGQTLTSGGVITANGEIVSLAAGDQTGVIMVGSATSTTTVHLGGIINSIGGFQTGTLTPAYVTASKASSFQCLQHWGLSVVAGVAGVIVLASWAF